MRGGRSVFKASKLELAVDKLLSEFWVCWRLLFFHWILVFEMSTSNFHPHSSMRLANYEPNNKRQLSFRAAEDLGCCSKKVAPISIKKPYTELVLLRNQEKNSTGKQVLPELSNSPQ